MYEVGDLGANPREDWAGGGVKPCAIFVHSVEKLGVRSESEACLTELESTIHHVHLAAWGEVCPADVEDSAAAHPSSGRATGPNLDARPSQPGAVEGTVDCAKLPLSVRASVQEAQSILYVYTCTKNNARRI